MAQPPRASGSHAAAAGSTAASSTQQQPHSTLAQPQSPQQQAHSSSAAQHADLDALATLAASPSPSPALSAYSYGSSASGDDELAALSLDDWAYPHRRRSSAGSAASGAPDPLDDDAPDVQRIAELRDGAGSGVATPVAPASHSRLAALRRALDPRRLVARHRHGTEPGEGDEEEEEEEGEGEGFDLQDEDEEDMHAAGVPAARGWRLDAR